MSEFSYVYGKALYDLAKEEGKTDLYLEELNGIRLLFKENPDYIKLLDTPALPLYKRQSLIDEAFSGVETNIKSFIKILASEKCAYLGVKAIDEFEKLFDEENGIERVKVITAVPLNEAQKSKLTLKLASLLDKKIILEEKTDKKILGGVVLELKNSRYDGSIKNRLDALCAMIKG